MSLFIPELLPCLEYAYTHTKTQGTTGYFACEPPKKLSFEEALARLEATPWDDFLHGHLLRLLSVKDLDELRALAATCLDEQGGALTLVRPATASLLLECALLLPPLADVRACFPKDLLPEIQASAIKASPAVYLRAALLPDHAEAAAWSAAFDDNICQHHPLPWPNEAHVPLLFSSEALRESVDSMAEAAKILPQVYEQLAENPGPARSRLPEQETFLRAVDSLMEAGILAGPEMRHEASLSPVALLRSWHVDIAVENGCLRHSLRGTATAYGRGLSLAGARASYAMEIVERASAYVGIEPARLAEAGGLGWPGGAGRSVGAATANGFAWSGSKDDEGLCGYVTGRKQPMPLIRACFSALRMRGRMALDPTQLPLETPYEDEVLHWVFAESPDGARVLVPAQAVFLFCNLDEQAFFLAGGSTGLASGNAPAEARVAALTEIIERDAEASTPFNSARLFTLQSREPRIQSLLDDYAARGIVVQFQDITTEIGVPVYQCFVMGRDNIPARATGANLCGARAALSALTETPWPYPNGGPSGQCGYAPGSLPVRVLEDLPDYSLPSPEANLRLLERVLIAHDRSPLYVDITRADLDLPVVRALIPGLELASEWDAFSRPSKRLFARWMAEQA